MTLTKSYTSFGLDFTGTQKLSWLHSKKAAKFGFQWFCEIVELALFWASWEKERKK